MPFFLTWFTQYDIIDDDNTGLMIGTFGEIYLQNESLFLNYFINTSIVAISLDRSKKLYIETRTYNKTENCEEIQSLIFRLDITLKRLKNPNTTTIANIIPINNLMLDVKWLTTINNSTNLLYDYAY